MTRWHTHTHTEVLPFAYVPPTLLLRPLQTPPPPPGGLKRFLVSWLLQVLCSGLWSSVGGLAARLKPTTPINHLSVCFYWCKWIFVWTGLICSAAEKQRAAEVWFRLCLCATVRTMSAKSAMLWPLTSHNIFTLAADTKSRAIFYFLYLLQRLKQEIHWENNLRLVDFKFLSLNIL